MITLKGLIIPKSWAENGTVTSVGLAGFDEKEYLIEPDDMGQALLRHLHQPVEVTCTLVEEDQVPPTIRVAGFTLTPTAFTDSDTPGNTSH